MPKPENIAQAGLVGWRKAIADNLAPRAASRAPVSEERLRAAIGAAFFLLSLYYVASTIARMVKSAQSRFRESRVPTTGSPSSADGSASRTWSSPMSCFGRSTQRSPRPAQAWTRLPRSRVMADVTTVPRRITALHANGEA